jgi:hypothetical protein
MSRNSKRDQIITAIKQQLTEFHPSIIAGLTGTSVPYVTNVILSLSATGQLQEVKNGRKLLYRCIPNITITTTTGVTTPVGNVNVLSDIPVKERFEYVARFTQMVVDGKLPSMFFTGASGIGKTHLIRDVLKSNGLKEGPDYTFIKGHTSPFGLFSTLYYNREKLIVFDDCDKAFDNDISASLLKAALDSYDKRIVSWLSRTIPADSDIESTFDFKGRVIFISNQPVDSIDDAVKTRTICVSLHMSRAEITAHMHGLLNTIEPKQPLALKQEVLEYLETVKEKFTSYNLRTLIKSIRIRSAYSNEQIWKNMIKMTALNE